MVLALNRRCTLPTRKLFHVCCLWNCLATNFPFSYKSHSLTSKNRHDVNPIIYLENTLLYKSMKTICFIFAAHTLLVQTASHWIDFLLRDRCVLNAAAGNKQHFTSPDITKSLRKVLKRLLCNSIIIFLYMLLRFSLIANPLTDFWPHLKRYLQFVGLAGVIDLYKKPWWGFTDDT